MPLINQTTMNFAGGELGPSVRARSDIKVYANGCERLENFLLETTGPIKYRTGTTFVNPTRRNALGRFIPFQFSDKQAYLIECTPGYFRFYKDGGIIVNTDKVITGVTNANPAVVTIVGHGYNNGDEFFVANTGLEYLDGKSFIVKNKTTDTVQLYDEYDNAINTIGLAVYSSGGIANKIVEVVTPYTDITGMTADQVMDYLHKIQFSQNADTMYVVHPDYAPRKLTRSSHTDWTFNTFVRTADPFTGVNDYPGSVSFDGAGRIVYGGTYNNPEMIIMSRGPASDTGNARYDDFTKGTLANDSLKIFLAPSLGKVDAIQWLAVNNRYFLAGTYSGIRRVVSSDGADAAFSADTGAIVRPLDSTGCEAIKRPIPKGNQVFYLQRGGLVLRCLEYDLVYDAYKPVDKNLVSDMITSGGVREIVFQQGRPDVIWGVRKDGTLLGLTYHETEDVAGWQRHPAGGNGKALSAGVMPRDGLFDQVWLINERKINGKTKRYVEYFADFQEFLTPEDFFTSEESQTADQETYENDMFERQKLELHLDCAMIYDGSLLGTDKNVTITVGAITNGIATFTSNVDIFKAGDLDRQIWRIHERGIGSGRASIVEFIDAKNVVCKILKDFDIATLKPGVWTLTTDDISGLDHLEGLEVGILTDGAVHNNMTVTNGKIKLSAQADVTHVGLRYRGLIKTMNLNAGGVSGSAQNKPRNVYKVVFEFLNSLGAKYGTSLYKLTKLDFRSSSNYTNRPSPLFSGGKEQRLEDKTARRKHVYVVQDSPLPCTIQAIDVFMETVDE